MRHRASRHGQSRGSAWDRGGRRDRGPTISVAYAMLAGMVMACAGREAVPPSAAAPPADFLLAAGDSTFWITSGPSGVHVRGSPLVLARYGGKFYEVYVADEDHSYYDAVFTTQRIYRRDLVTGDSVAVFLDSSVARAAHGYSVAHPDERPLEPDEDAADDPSTSVTGEVDIVDVHGPYLSFEYRGSAAAKRSVYEEADSTPERATIRRGVVDLRVGGRATPKTLFGPSLGDTAIDRGLRAYAAAQHSIRDRRTSGDERARLASAVAGDFIFDPTSFAVTDVARDPGVQFFALGRGARSRGLTLPLSPVTVPEAATVAWWAAERTALPIGGADSASDVWARPDLEVVARYDTLGGPGQGQGVVVLIREAGSGSGITRAAGVTRPREWRIGRFPAPTRRLYWLDRPALDSATRRALVRAFNESALYGDDARSVGHPLSPAARRPAPVAFTALAHRPRAGPAGVLARARATSRRGGSRRP